MLTLNAESHYAIRPGLPALVLAPMEGVTDAPMRALLTERGGFSFCVSEFLRVSQQAPPARVFRRHVPELNVPGCLTPSGKGVLVQLLGGDPARLADAAQVALAAGARGIDLNFGCPAPTVNRHDGGATLLKHPERIRSIVRAVREAVPSRFPVSAKLRLGWDSPDPVLLNARMAEEGGASWVTLHGRTKVQGYQPPAYWQPIGAVRRALSIPVVANGDIWTLGDFRRCREETGCEHFMIGRPALADPALAPRLAAELGLCSQHEQREFRYQWRELFQRFAEISAGFGSPEHAVVRRIKQWVKLSHLRSPLPWFDRLKHGQSLTAVLAEVPEDAGS